MDMKEDLQQRIAEMAYGDIQVVAMVDRGPYADTSTVDEATDSADATTGASQNLATTAFVEWATGFKAADEDVISVQRADLHVAMNQSDFEWYLEQLTQPKHLIFLQCLDLSTTEIKQFLNFMSEKKVLENAKVFLLDLPQLEYMTLRDAMTTIKL